jgi:hypothetical protein
VKEVIWPVVIGMALLGVISLWLKQIMMAQRKKVPGMTPVSIQTYWVDNWASTLFALTSTAGGLAFVDYLGMLGGKAGPAIAFGIGFIGNSVADLIGGRVQSLINPGAPVPYDSTKEPMESKE